MGRKLGKQRRRIVIDYFQPRSDWSLILMMRRSIALSLKGGTVAAFAAGRSSKASISNTSLPIYVGRLSTAKTQRRREFGFPIRAIHQPQLLPEATRKGDDDVKSEPRDWKIKMLYDGDCPLCMREVICCLVGCLKFFIPPVLSRLCVIIFVCRLIC